MYLGIEILGYRDIEAEVKNWTMNYIMSEQEEKIYKNLN